MTASTAPASHRAAARKDKAPKKSFWSMEIGKKSPAEEKVEHPSFTPTLPWVDLLPASIRSRQALRRVIRLFAMLLVLLLAIGAVIWYLQGSRIDEAQAALTSAQTDQQAVQQKIAGLAPVKEMYTQINAQKELVNGTLASQPEATAVIDRLYTVAGRSGGPKGIEITGSSYNYQGIPRPGATLNQCANPDPFGKSITIGCLTFEASATSREAVSEFLTNLAADPMFVGPYVATSTIAAVAPGEPTRVIFSGTSGISLAALQQKLSAQQIDALINPPADPAAPTEDAS
jgi:Tfp pilus assembly protein PilN